MEILDLLGRIFNFLTNPWTLGVIVLIGVLANLAKEKQRQQPNVTRNTEEYQDSINPWDDPQVESLWGDP